MMNYFLFFFFFVGIFFLEYVDYVQATREKRLVGGNVTENDTFSYTVFIYRNYDQDLKANDHCTGSILDDYHIISAAHCFIEIEKYPYIWRNASILVVAGVKDLINADRAKWINATVQRIYVPKMYNDSLQNNLFPALADIAVLKLKTPLNLSKNQKLRTVTIPKNTEILYSNETAVITAYGANEAEIIQVNGVLNQTKNYDYKLRFANTTVLSNSECQRIEDSWSRVNQNITEKHICSRIHQRDLAKAEGACNGDSGGPLIYRENILIGVMNNGPSSCLEDESPSIYARISALQDFITKAQNYDENRYNDPEILVATL